jgi:hypothetical protein
MAVGLFGVVARRFCHVETDFAGLMRAIVSPVVALLLLSAITRAGLVSFQALYSRQRVTVEFFGPNLDGALWVMLTAMLGLVAISDMLWNAKQSGHVRHVSIVLVALVSFFVATSALNLVLAAITAGALIYFLDLFTPPAGIRGWSTLGVKIFGILVIYTFSSVLAVTGELAYPTSVRSGGTTLPWLLSKATQLTLAVYHGLDPVVSLFYAILVTLSLASFLAVVFKLAPRLPWQLPRLSHELSEATTLAVALGLCALASFLLAVPYLVAGRPIGVDFNWYIDRVNELQGSQGFHDLQLFPHPVVLLITLAAGQLVRGPPELAVQLTMESVAIFAAVSQAWFVHEMTQDWGTSLFSVLFTLFSIRTTVGYFAGLLANWLAIAEVFIALGLLIRFLREGKRINLACILVLNGLVFSTHVQTWVMLSVLMLLFGMWRRSLLIWSALLVLALIATTISSPAFVSLLTAQMLDVAHSSSLENPLSLLGNLATVGRFFAAGLFNDPVLLVLSIIGLLCASFGLKSRAASYPVLAWTALAAFPVIFLDATFAWRVLYQIPYETFAALGVSAIWQVCEDPSKTGKLSSYLPTTVLLAICLAAVFDGIRGILLLVV